MLLLSAAAVSQLADLLSEMTDGVLQLDLDRSYVNGLQLIIDLERLLAGDRPETERRESALHRACSVDVSSDSFVCIEFELLDLSTNGVKLLLEGGHLEFSAGEAAYTHMPLAKMFGKSWNSAFSGSFEHRKEVYTAGPVFFETQEYSDAQWEGEPPDETSTWRRLLQELEQELAEEVGEVPSFVSGLFSKWILMQMIVDLSGIKMSSEYCVCLPR